MASRAQGPRGLAAPLDSISVAASGRYQAPSSATETRMIMGVVLSASDWRLQGVEFVGGLWGRRGVERGRSPFNAAQILP
ncbi:hypothetical protein CSW58_12060 [Caulobacter sp. B11]|nr:hypothetical protein CSW58_12060 [Caulobacter sp. B11]